MLLRPTTPGGIHAPLGKSNEMFRSNNFRRLPPASRSVVISNKLPKRSIRFKDRVFCFLFSFACKLSRVTKNAHFASRDIAMDTRGSKRVAISRGSERQECTV